MTTQKPPAPNQLAIVRAGADVYILDDPLSAVDAHVGSHLLSEAICGLLGGATRVLVRSQAPAVLIPAASSAETPGVLDD